MTKSIDGKFHNHVSNQMRQMINAAMHCLELLYSTIAFVSVWHDTADMGCEERSQGDRGHAVG